MFREAIRRLWGAFGVIALVALTVAPFLRFDTESGRMSATDPFETVAPNRTRLAHQRTPSSAQLDHAIGVVSAARLDLLQAGSKRDEQAILKAAATYEEAIRSLDRAYRTVRERSDAEETQGIWGQLCTLKSREAARQEVYAWETKWLTADTDAGLKQGGERE